MVSTTKLPSSTISFNICLCAASWQLTASILRTVRAFKLLTATNSKSQFLYLPPFINVSQSIFHGAMATPGNLWKQNDHYLGTEWWKGDPWNYFVQIHFTNTKYILIYSYCILRSFICPINVVLPRIPQLLVS